MILLIRPEVLEHTFDKVKKLSGKEELSFQDSLDILISKYEKLMRSFKK